MIDKRITDALAKSRMTDKKQHENDLEKIKSLEDRIAELETSNKKLTSDLQTLKEKEATVVDNSAGFFFNTTTSISTFSSS